MIVTVAGEELLYDELIDAPLDHPEPKLPHSPAIFRRPASSSAKVAFDIVLALRLPAVP